MNSFIHEIITWGKAHKIVSAIVLVVLIGAGYGIVRAFSSNTGETRYVLGTVQKGTVITTVSGSGQVSASNELSIKPEVSGKVTSVVVKSGQKVSAGSLIAQLDSTEAQKSVRDAEIALKSAQLDLESLKMGNTQDLKDAQDAVTSAYTKLLNSSPQVVPYDIHDNYADTQVPTLSGSYSLGKEGDIIIETYAATGGFAYNLSGLAGVSGMVNDIIAQPLGDSGLFIKFATSGSAQLGKKWVVHIPNKSASDYSSNEEAYQKAKDDLNNLGGVSTTDVLSLQKSELSVQQKQNALQDAKDTLAKYYITAPFSGTVGAVDIERYATVGAADSIATLITDQKMAELSLNEVDVAKVKAGDKATLTFDAVEDLTLTGAVVQVDSVGTVDQGVVSYKVKIGFDSQDGRIKSGMTVNANIQTDVHQDVLTVPSSAVKTQNGVSVVQVFDPPLPETGGTQGVTSVMPPTQVQVTMGISGDTTVEITSGLTEGQQVVTRTSTGAAPVTPSSIRGGTGAVGGIRL